MKTFAVIAKSKTDDTSFSLYIEAGSFHDAEAICKDLEIDVESIIESEPVEWQSH